LGAAGFIATGPELFGRGAARIMALGSAAPSLEPRRLHIGLTTIYETLMNTGTWPAALKAALTLLGLPAGVPREPVHPLTPEATQKLRQVITELGLL
jgi:4-hydroxy-tetrahydrodipicolinate synthase